MRKKMMILVLFSILLMGCKTTSVYVLDEAELIRVKEGDFVTVKFDGWVLSDRAVDRVMNAKIKSILK